MRYVSMNTTIKPFDNLNVRKAVVAGSDRNALRLTRGGAVVGDLATHFLPPGSPASRRPAASRARARLHGQPRDGRSPELTCWRAHEEGRLPIEPGKWTGSDELLMVGLERGPRHRRPPRSRRQSFEKLGFKVKPAPGHAGHAVHEVLQRPVREDRASARTSAGSRTSPTPQSMLDPAFNGKNILPQNNSNWPQLDVPAINAAMARRKLLTEPAERAKAWADVGQDGHRAGPGGDLDLGQDAADRLGQRHAVASPSNTPWDFAWTSLK